MYYDDGRMQRTIPSDGVLRLEQIDEVAEPIDGMFTVRTRYGGIQGLPSGISAGDVLIVSTLVGDKWQAIDRPLKVVVLVPDTGSSCKRGSDGRIDSVSRYIWK